MTNSTEDDDDDDVGLALDALDEFRSSASLAASVASEPGVADMAGQIYGMLPLEGHWVMNGERQAMEMLGMLEDFRDLLRKHPPQHPDLMGLLDETVSCISALVVALGADQEESSAKT